MNILRSRGIPKSENVFGKVLPTCNVSLQRLRAFGQRSFGATFRTTSSGEL